jgi:hypothetical protein
MVKRQTSCDPKKLLKIKERKIAPYIKKPKNQVV